MFKVFKTFYKFIFKKKLIFVGFVLLTIISNVLFSLNPVFYKKFVDAIPNLDQQELIRILIAFISIRIVAVLFDLINFWVGDLILFDSAIDARRTIFKKIQDLDFAFHSEKSTGSLISAFKRGDSAMFSFFHDIHHKMFSVLISFSVMAYYFFELNKQIIFILICSLIITILIANFLVKNNVNKRKLFNKDEDEISGIITDNLINFDTVKLFSKEKWEENRLVKNFIPWLSSLWGYANSFRLIDISMGLTTTLSIFLVLLITINQALNLKLSIGEFVLITGFLSNFFPKLWELVWGTRDLAKNYADIEKYFAILDNNIEVKDPKKPIKLKHVKGNIEFKNVSHSYKDGTKNAIKDLNLSIKKGESVAFVGKSGSGKTTITKLLMRFFDPTSGSIEIDGIDIKKFTKANLRNFFGVVPQESILFNNTIKYNIEYGKDSNVKSSITVEKASRLANISEFINSLSKKYETNVGERGIKLSGGQKQRLAIARMIMSDPDIIIFDEATSHLDSHSEKLIQDAFWKYARGKTTIVIAHRLSTIARADRIVVLDKGKIVEMGKHDELLKKSSGIYKNLWNIQSV